MTAASDPTDLERRVAQAIDPFAFDEWEGDHVEKEAARRILQNEALERARRAITECFRWQPIETAPKDDMILARRGNLMWVVLWSSDFDEWMVSQTSTVRGLTHWMPRPAALSEDEG